mgnify:CR=1 FL=1
MMAPDMPWFRHFITKMVQAQNTYVCRIIQHMPYAEQMPMDSLGISPENDLKVLTEAAEKITATLAICWDFIIWKESLVYRIKRKDSII